jgi:hypothetical protein
MILIPLLAFLIRPLKRRWQRRREERALGADVVLSD